MDPQRAARSLATVRAHSSRLGGSWFRLSAVLAGFAAATTPHPAAAQSCHVPTTTSAADGPTVSLALREATVDAGPLQADYQGALLGLGYAFGTALPLEANVVLPAYRLDAGTEEQVGLGDLLLDVRGVLLSTQHERRDHRDQLQAGVELAATLPTARDATGLGMGHVMLMPGLFLRVHDERAALFVQAGYGRALSEAGHGAHVAEQAHMHAAVQGSVVDPMNASELESALTLSVRLGAGYALLGSLAGAVPIASEGGRARAAASAGASAALGPLTLTLMMELPLGGDPFEQRATLSAALSP